MQNHTGEHIVSGLLCSTFGADNVGFHMGSEDVTLDINVEITKDDLRNIELLANRAIYENIPVNIFYPERDTRRSRISLKEGFCRGRNRADSRDLRL